MAPQEVVAILPVTLLHLVVAVQAVQSGFGDVDPPGMKRDGARFLLGHKLPHGVFFGSLAVGNGPYSPRDPPRLQLVGDVHVPGPDVELPLPEAQNATQHGARVDPDAHVDVVFCTRAHVSERQEPLFQDTGSRKGSRGLLPCRDKQR